MGLVAQVTVLPRDDGTFEVNVLAKGASTTHRVSVPPGYPEALGCKGLPAHELIEASFGFLLDREPPTSILRRFSLDQIASYYPDFPRTIARYLQEVR
jgi:hypothetical protein